MILPLSESDDRAIPLVVAPVRDDRRSMDQPETSTRVDVDLANVIQHLADRRGGIYYHDECITGFNDGSWVRHPHGRVER